MATLSNEGVIVEEVAMVEIARLKKLWPTHRGTEILSQSTTAVDQVLATLLGERLNSTGLIKTVNLV